MIETVDSFQGKQLDVVILSCVRASPDAAAGGGPATVGFVSDVRRLNVVRRLTIPSQGLCLQRPLRSSLPLNACFLCCVPAV